MREERNENDGATGFSSECHWKVLVENLHEMIGRIAA
jgi:hypothetical protein